MQRYRTPLRYPGGKQRLAPFVREVLAANNLIGGHYVEPYAGGAGVAIELLLDRHVQHIHLNDSSLPVYAFWKAIVTDPDALARRILSGSLDVDEWRKRREIVRHPTEHDPMELAFSTLYLNRCNRSGVLTGGLIGGLAQSGDWTMGVRFPRNELIKRIEAIAGLAHSISVYHNDAEQFMLETVRTFPEATLVYCDPPYFGKRSRLYLDSYKAADHGRVARTIQDDLQRRWVVSYDAAPEIHEYYAGRRSFVYSLQYNAGPVYRGNEVFIFCDELNIPERSSVPYVDYAIRGLAASNRVCKGH